MENPSPFEAGVVGSSLWAKSLPGYYPSKYGDLVGGGWLKPEICRRFA
jgi:hypothetical protein